MKILVYFEEEYDSFHGRYLEYAELGLDESYLEKGEAEESW